jgi:tRNA threonylcarbamoyladenosine dehydratase
MSDSESRFGGIARLYGREGLARLQQASLCVVGIGGVGSWAVEALARSGVGAITLVDLDEVCVTNINRQIHALDNTVGRSKAEVMAERVRGIAPECRVRAELQFFTDTSAAEILREPFSAVIDAIDTVANKCRLIAECRTRAIPVVVCGGAGGRRDPAQVRVADLARSTHDRLLQKVREQLRREHGFARGEQLFGVECVYSPEAPVFPQTDGSICTQPESGTELRLNCDRGYGTASFVTGAFGFLAASLAVRRITMGNLD